MSSTHDNLFLSNTSSNIPFTSRKSGRDNLELPQRKRKIHGDQLETKFKKLWTAVEHEGKKKNALSLSLHSGTYIEFISSSGFELYLKSLEQKQSGIQLLNSKFVEIKGERFQVATVFVPKGKEHIYMNKIDAYLHRDTDGGNPLNKKLIESVNDIRLAVVESFFPKNHLQWLDEKEEVWYEIWLSDDLVQTEEVFREDVEKVLGLEMREEILRFPDRTVVMIKASKKHLELLIKISPFIAEIRRAAEPNSYFVYIDNSEQLEWVEEAKERVVYNPKGVVINILDTGVRRTHKLLEDFMRDEDMVAYDHSWDKNDFVGHGTGMAGIALYDNLKAHLEGTEQIQIEHSLESSKILPDRGENEPRLFGAITSRVISEQIINNPEKTRVNCMAVTTPKIDTGDGSPSSWSAAIDEITAGVVDEQKKLFIISAGNIEQKEWSNYPQSNITSSVQNPAQAWNAVTVGAYTNKAYEEVPEYSSDQITSPKGGLSPSSSTSILWENKWPVKPEIVLEGGNAIKFEDGSCMTHENLSSLTTYNDIFKSQFDYINSTSEATAHAAWMAAKIQSKYPDSWPETVRALLIHSSSWTEAMKQQFLTSNNKTGYRDLLRTCGYGVPNIEKSINSFDNHVNLIVESYLQPYQKTSKGYKTKDMHIHELPWPKEMLLDLGSKQVQMKVTLSYFIEPGPGEKGWQNKYRYPSSLLRFQVNGSDSKEEFLSRINKAAELDDDYTSRSSNVKWLLGPNNRDVGSIHSDTWMGTAAELATSNLIGIYPLVGWWRERTWLNRANQLMRYSLIVSLSCVEDIDIYTPIYNEVTNNIKNQIEI